MCQGTQSTCDRLAVGLGAQLDTSARKEGEVASVTILHMNDICLNIFVFGVFPAQVPFLHCKFMCTSNGRLCNLKLVCLKQGWEFAHLIFVQI